MQYTSGVLLMVAVVQLCACFFFFFLLSTRVKLFQACLTHFILSFAIAQCNSKLSVIYVPAQVFLPLTILYCIFEISAPVR